MPKSTISNDECTRADTQSILCIGAANIDVRCAFDAFSVDGTSNIATISQTVGGAALNTARILAANTIDTKFVGLVGDDEGAGTIAQALIDADVKSGLIKLTGSASGQYISLIEPDGSLKTACNDMKIHENLSMQLLEAQFIAAKENDYSAVFCDANIPADIIYQAFLRMPQSLKCATTVSPAKAPRLEKSLELIDVLFTNVAEARTLLGLNRDANIEILAARLASSPAKFGVISDGGSQVYYWQTDNAGMLQVPAIDNIVDVVGAGDALAAGTIAALLNGNNFTNAIHHGIISAQKVLQVSGAYPPRFA